jgi:S-adenosylmethionine:diacylglycerol 3-amino-3-carboxypropyl transferase
MPSLGHCQIARTDSGSRQKRNLGQRQKADLPLRAHQGRSARAAEWSEAEWRAHRPMERLERSRSLSGTLNYFLAARHAVALARWSDTVEMNARRR